MYTILKTLPIQPRRRLPIICLIFLSFFITSSFPANAQSAAAVWSALKAPGHFVIMRHAIASGREDDENFRLDDCSTQAALSEEGRRQARRIGEAFRENGITAATIYSSEWCLCLETARLLQLGRVRPLDALNSFFSDRSKGAVRMQDLRDKILDMDLSQTVIFVTHQVNVTGMTGIYPKAGEMVVMNRTDDGRLNTVGSLLP